MSQHLISTLLIKGLDGYDSKFTINSISVFKAISVRYINTLNNTDDTYICKIKSAQGLNTVCEFIFPDEFKVCGDEYHFQCSNKDESINILVDFIDVSLPCDKPKYKFNDIINNIRDNIKYGNIEQVSYDDLF